MPSIILALGMRIYLSTRDWELQAQVFYLGLDFFKLTTIVSVFHRFGYPFGNFFHLGFFHAASGDSRRAETDTAWSVRRILVIGKKK